MERLFRNRLSIVSYHGETHKNREKGKSMAFWGTGTGFSAFDR